MKEVRYFYVPDALHSTELPPDEARHALRVLRLGMGDELYLMDGAGLFLRAEITGQTGHRCQYAVVEELPQARAWLGHLHIAMAPTKMNERVEWLSEKATEIGVDEFSFVDCQFSERHQLKADRVERIVVSAVKQSRKAWMPRVNPMLPLERFLREPRTGGRFICHCYNPADIGPKSKREPLLGLLDDHEDATVLIGPEGDFSVEEVRLAESLGWRSVTLGTSRLRTETAALVAVHLMQLTHQLPEQADSWAAESDI